MSEKSAQCGPACTRRNSSAGFGARGRCEASTGLEGVLVVKRLFPCYDVSLVCVRGQIAYLASRSCSTLVVTTHRLTEVRKNHFVPPEYELHAPLPGEHPYDVFPSGFSLSTDALEAGLRFPLHPVIEACLER
ncbi:hypothetical protein B296_00055775 [Ensete ventricosum]|uniref:Uncharacterized protein n=1 Tax=Ensete ventricosum TaxID=4639 RepID=A0A426XBH5_ENSVE|nr:hypothetical protein B296_00055775 [Ensete ventricosum]